MKPIDVRRRLFVFITIVGLAVPATAQNIGSDILNSLELAQLVARAGPADHLRLSVHFSALGDRYAAEARRHRSMSRFPGNPGRTSAASTSVHCRQLADLNTRSAATARELAAYHRTLASGSWATPPRDAPRFHAGTGAPEPSEHQVNVAVARARTASEQGVLREYFLARMSRYTNEAGEHIRLAQIYRGTRIAHAAVHRDWLAERARAAAKEARATADVNTHLGTWTE